MRPPPPSEPHGFRQVLTMRPLSVAARLGASGRAAGDGVAASERGGAPTRRVRRRCQMRGSKANLPVDVDAGGAVIRQAEWGEMNAALESFQPGIDTAPLFQGL